MSEVSATPVWLQRKERGSVWLLRLMSWLSLTLGRRLTRVVVRNGGRRFLTTLEH